MKLLQTAKKYPFEHKVLLFTQFIYLLMFVYSFVDMIFIVTIAPLAVVIELISFIIIAISLYKKRDEFIVYLIIGQTFAWIFIIINLLFYEGYLLFSDITRYSAGIGISLEAFIFSYLLSYRVNFITKLTKNQQSLIEYQDNKLGGMEEIIDNIAHQWRQPLSQINSAVLIIDDELHTTHNDVQIEQKLQEIEDMTSYMSKSIDDFRNFYSTSEVAEKFLILDAIKNSLNIIKSTLELHGIKVNITNNEELFVDGIITQLQQTILVLLNNAKDSLVESKSNEPMITITYYKEQSSIYIQICDNGKGIPIELHEKIFQPYFSTKTDKGSGIGLYLSRRLIENSFDGYITLKKPLEGQGICFVIRINPKRY